MDTEQGNTNTNTNTNVPNRRKASWSGYGSLYGGVYLLVVGILFLLNSFGYFQGDAWGKLWPVFIIIPAFFMIFRPWSRR